MHRPADMRSIVAAHRRGCAPLTPRGLATVAAQPPRPTGPSIHSPPMCGIVGYVGDKQAQGVVIEGLRRLEYRGYDSAGIAWSTTGGHRVLRKRPASWPTSRRPWPSSRSGSTTGIGHTRWATHGRRPTRNAHPPPRPGGIARRAQRDHRELRRAAHRAGAAGHEMLSETDTEIAAHLVELELLGRRRPTTAMQATLSPARRAPSPWSPSTREDPDRVVAARPQLAARGRAGRGRELPRLRRRRASSSTPARPSSSARTRS